MKTAFLVLLASLTALPAFASAPFSFESAAKAFCTGTTPTNAQLLGKWKLVGLAKDCYSEVIYNLNGIVNRDGSLRDELGFANQKNMLDGSMELLVGINGAGYECRTHGPFPVKTWHRSTFFTTTGYEDSGRPRLCRILPATGALLCQYGWDASGYDLYVRE
jgi:hypothetical protein